MPRATRPTLHAPDISNIPGRPPAPATQVADPRFAVAETLEDPAALTRRVREGSVRVLNPDTIQQAAGPAGVPVPGPTRRRSPELSLSTKVPEYVMHQLRVRSAEKGVTIRNLLLLALRREGFEIDDDDVYDERKRR